MKIYVHLCYFLTEQEMLKTKLVEKIKTHILCSNFFQKLYCVWDNVEKYGTARHATDNNALPW